MERKTIICTTCPLGCLMDIEIIDKNNIKVDGNSCNRGKSYAKKECFSPERVITTTVKAYFGGKRVMLPVKTDISIPKNLVFKVIEEVDKITIKEKTSIGDVVIKNVLDTGGNIVLTGERL